MCFVTGCIYYSRRCICSLGTEYNLGSVTKSLLSDCFLRIPLEISRLELVLQVVSQVMQNVATTGLGIWKLTLTL